MSKRTNPAVPFWTRIPWPIYALVLVVLVIIAYRLATPTGAHAQHPAPRPGVTAGKVMPAQRYAEHPHVARVYDMARKIPHILDGIYCYCECSKHSGHRSLLSCHESDHAAACDVCLGEAALAYQLHEQGKTLEQIRAQIDASYAP